VEAFIIMRALESEVVDVICQAVELPHSARRLLDPQMTTHLIKVGTASQE
jgi:hypothetical protein